MSIAFFRCLLVISLFFVSLTFETIAQSADPQATGVKAELQPWQRRQIAFFEMFKKVQSGDAEARKAFDGNLTEYETHVMSRTPMENMDIQGVFYVPREGIEKCLPVVAMNAALGWYDALRYASESGRSEIVSNHKFFSRALTLGGSEKSKQAVKFLQENPERARELVEQGLKFGDKFKDAPGYDHQWVTAFGIERVINSLSGKSTIVPMPKESWCKAWEDAKRRVREYYNVPIAKTSE